MTLEQHNVLTQLAQLGLQRLTELASTALDETRPVAPSVEPVPVEDTPE